MCHYWFFNNGIKFQDSVSIDCHNLTMLSVNISYIAIITVHYYCIICSITRSGAINLLKNNVHENCGYI